MASSQDFPPVQGVNPRTDEPVGAPIAVTTSAELDAVARRANDAARAWARWGRAERADVLESVAAAIDVSRDELVTIADAETALGRARLEGEVTRTSGQLRLFAEVLREGSYTQAVISPAADAQQRPDVRRMVHPVGAVAVYSASNFPFAFSVAGGDTVSALASGCSVVVKAHDAHPQTSALTYEVVAKALAASGAPADLLSVVYGFTAGVELVQHPQIKAAGFTGSRGGGRALFDLAAGRPDPIPFYGELGSTNPVVVLPNASQERATEIASGFVGSLTLGNGQFCTNPGLLFVPRDADALLAGIAADLGGVGSGPMLTSRMAEAYTRRNSDLAAHDGLSLVADGVSPSDDASAAVVRPQLRRVDLPTFIAHIDELAQECFGPSGIVVTYSSPSDLPPVLDSLEPSLTASVHASPADLPFVPELQEVMSRTAGRLVFNGWPTGVAVCWAMHHGGPWPATTAQAHTSVGATSIARWLVPVAYQNWPDELLPDELRRSNPGGVVRRTDASLGLE